MIGTSTITSSLAPTTLISSGLPADAANDSANSSGLSSGARTGIIVGSVVGGVLLLAALLLCCFCMRRRKKQKQRDDDAIRWPEIANQADLYPQQVHQTGRAGVGGEDEMEEYENGGLYAAGAGAAAGAAYAGSRHPTLPQVENSSYSHEMDTPYSGYGTAAAAAAAGPRGYSPPDSNYGNNTGYSTAGPNSVNSHAPLAPGPASIEYNRAAGYNPNNNLNGFERNSPSPNEFAAGGGSSGGDHSDLPPNSGNLPLPGSDLGHQYNEDGYAGYDRPISPVPMQDYSNGYDNGEPQGRMRLSVVNHD